MTQEQILVKGFDNAPETYEDEFEASHQKLIELFKNKKHSALREEARLLGGAVVARVLKRLERDMRKKFVKALGDEFSPDMLAELDEELLADIVPILGVKKLVTALHKLQTDDASAITQALPESLRERVLKRLSKGEQRLLQSTLAYPEKSAGRLMQREIVAIPSSWTVAQTLAYLKKEPSLPDDFFDVQIIDPYQHPLGVVALNRLVRAASHKKMTEVMDTHLSPIRAASNQEDVAFLFRDQDITSHPVVDDAGRLVGVITIDDVVDVIDDEAQEDIMRLGGISETGATFGFLRMLRARFTWLLFNLCATFATAFVISHFTDEIEKVVALAILMPMVASMGGIAAVQSLTVTVRALAMKELGADNLYRSILREVFMNFSSGMVLSVMASLIVWGWLEDDRFSLLIFIAMIANLSLAGLLGSVMPWLFNRLKIDPAIASGPCVTALTDIIGFLSFLSLARFYLMDTPAVGN